MRRSVEDRRKKEQRDRKLDAKVTDSQLQCSSVGSI